MTLPRRVWRGPIWFRAALVGAIVLLAWLLADGWWPKSGAWILLAVAPLLYFAGRVLLSGIAVGPEGVASIELFRTRRVAWSDIAQAEVAASGNWNPRAKRVGLRLTSGRLMVCDGLASTDVERELMPIIDVINEAVRQA